MDTFVKATGCILIALIISIVLSKQGKDFSILLTVFVCATVSVTAVNYLSTILDFFDRLQILGKLDPEFIKVLLRSVGIGLVAEISALICSDAGNAALGKTIQLLGGAVVLWLSLPLFSDIIELVEEILVSV